MDMFLGHKFPQVLGLIFAENTRIIRGHVKFFHFRTGISGNWYTRIIHCAHVGIPEQLPGCPHISLSGYPSILSGVFSHSDLSAVPTK
jgi:hypothetical protein